MLIRFTANKVFRLVLLTAISVVVLIATIYLRSGHAQSLYDGANPVMSLNSSVALSTLASNKVALGNIGVGASPFQMTNPLPHTVMLFIGGGVVTGISVNGTIIGSGLTLTGITTISLQPGEWTTILYTVAPTVKWKPL